MPSPAAAISASTAATLGTANRGPILDPGVGVPRSPVAAHGSSRCAVCALGAAGKKAAADHLRPRSLPPKSSAQTVAIEGPCMAAAAAVALAPAAPAAAAAPASSACGLRVTKVCSWGKRCDCRGSNPSSSSARSASGPRPSTALSGKASRKARLRLAGAGGLAPSSTAVSASGWPARLGGLGARAAGRLQCACGSASRLSPTTTSMSVASGLNRAASRAACAASDASSSASAEVLGASSREAAARTHVRASAVA
mmetsp:Transcript_34257/g.86644  ORF Transcript_34257/g.86644 Transcript_34257/m.86644 type:complete len:255 (-) Transcript_34257:2135-2899(-)